MSVRRDARAPLALVGLGVVVALSGAGLFLGDASLPLQWGLETPELLRWLYVVLLVAGLTFATFRYAEKKHDQLDELALLVLLTCGVNFVVQLTGGGHSYWQGLYLVLGGLASVAFSSRLVGATVMLVISLETANWVFHPVGTVLDLVRLVVLFLFAVLGYNYMERAERDRAERAEDRLLRLNVGLKQLATEDTESDSPTPHDERVSPLSEEAQQAGRAEQVEQLEKHLEPLLELARAATGARTALLLQVSEDQKILWVRLVSGGGDHIASIHTRQLPLKGSVLPELLRRQEALCLSDPVKPMRLPWISGPQKIHSLLAVPIQIWSEPPWILVLDHLRPDHFDEKRRELADSVAVQMSEAQKLFKRQAKQHVDELELKGLLSASESLSAAPRLAELLRHMVEYGRHVGRFDSCAICLIAEGDEEFTVVVAEGHRREMLGRSFPLESPTWAAWVLRAREEPLAIRMERKSGMPVLDPREKPMTETSFLAVPLKTQKRVCGVMLLTRKAEAFSAREVRLLRIYSNQAAVAIENAIVYEQLESQAATDGLTGLFNRRYFQEALGREIARSQRKETQFALLMLDIDHFKGFNDTYGHAMGDLVLKKVADTLKGVLRKGDLLARYGGEEFVILLPQVTRAGAADSAERLRAAVAKAPLHPGGPRRQVTLSIGFALYPEEADSGDALQRGADEALYAAKERGRNRVCAYAELQEPILQ